MPLFRRRLKADADGYYATNLPAAAVREDELVQLKINGRPVLLTRIAGRLHAFSNVCPHAAADLGQGRLRRGQIKCPDHGYTFEIATGRAVWPEDEVCRLKRYAVREVEGMVQVRLEGD